MRFKEARGGFVAEVDGYLCFITPEVESGLLVFDWAVQSGGGWTFRGGDSVTQHATGKEFSLKCTIDSIVEALDKLGAALGGEDGIRALAQRA